MTTDPVCGMQVDEKNPGATTTYKGQTYYFCSAGCKADFEKNPEQYAKSQQGGQQASHH